MRFAFVCLCVQAELAQLFRKSRQATLELDDSSDCLFVEIRPAPWTKANRFYDDNDDDFLGYIAPFVEFIIAPLCSTPVPQLTPSDVGVIADIRSRREMHSLGLLQDIELEISLGLDSSYESDSSDDDDVTGETVSAYSIPDFDEIPVWDTLSDIRPTTTPFLLPRKPVVSDDDDTGEIVSIYSCPEDHDIPDWDDIVNLQPATVADMLALDPHWLPCSPIPPPSPM